eukprot:CAMPEP_0168314614 /NCGR_PEP_ID=MMETSP0210-20121227/9175_1 /TAXON_ID=40633 /ORGANISM="Condylostoma magnum, Strain COL2" /LENGTH=37 /DNA_ID= /DNA_START= /DNA_END= /DNA_ORIENTATION=
MIIRESNFIIEEVIEGEIEVEEMEEIEEAEEETGDFR